MANFFHLIGFQAQSNPPQSESKKYAAEHILVSDPTRSKRLSNQARAWAA